MVAVQLLLLLLLLLVVVLGTQLVSRHSLAGGMY
jgi:hypothetical protein